MEFKHEAVLPDEAIEGLNIKPQGKYIDATLGGGGHTGLILQKGGQVLGIDQDEEAVGYVVRSLESEVGNKKLKVLRGNFRDIKRLAIENGFGPPAGGVDGILFDLGVSSYQLDASGRGFSLKKDEKLDMRMDKSQSLSAYEVVNKYSKEELVQIFYKYGEEHNARQIAEEIVGLRKKKKIETTRELAGIIASLPHKNEPINPATRVFQAIRIVVNNELESLKDALVGSLSILEEGGRIVVISFHSLEDRIIKQAFIKWEREGLGKSVNKKPIVATYEEVAKNRRARSAKMRIFEKQGVTA